MCMSKGIQSPGNIYTLTISIMTLPGNATEFNIFKK